MLKDGKDIAKFDILGEPDNLPKSPLMSCNVYTGAFAIAEALAAGAQVIITGRASAKPIIYYFRACSRQRPRRWPSHP